MAWTTITNALVEVGAKPFATTIQALRDNPVAIADGDTGAPRVKGKALGSTFVGYGSSNGTTFTNFTDLDGMQTIKVDILKEDGYSGSPTIEVQFSSDNGATWGSAQDLSLSTFPGPEIAQGSVYINLVSGMARGFYAGNVTAVSVSTTLTVPTNCNAFGIRASTSGGTLRALVFCLGGIE